MDPTICVPLETANTAVVAVVDVLATGLIVTVASVESAPAGIVTPAVVPSVVITVVVPPDNEVAVTVPVEVEGVVGVGEGNGVTVTILPPPEGTMEIVTCKGLVVADSLFKATAVISN